LFIVGISNYFEGSFKYLVLRELNIVCSLSKKNESIFSISFLNILKILLSLISLINDYSLFGTTDHEIIQMLFLREV
jgi:hypothetical protein